MSIQIEIEKLLKDNFVKKELFFSTYHSTSVCYAISDEKEIFELNRHTEIDFNLVGVAFVVENVNSSNNICMFCIDRQFQNKGYGFILLSTLREIYKSLYLHVRVSNTNAIKLYEKVGFKKIEEKENFYEYTGNNENAYMMNV
jgi:ribosomal protein S18 acetylase RimI-like enzyme